jgi:antitoxin (DNA-binding transcriptional repressor) of toxin-antitoxin stability system
MPATSVEEAKQSLQAILEKVAKGEEVTIVHEGQVVARVVPPLSKEQPYFKNIVMPNLHKMSGFSWMRTDLVTSEIIFS